MSTAAKLLGTDKLRGRDGEVPASSLDGKILLIYFSASWCAPCRTFTPQLAAVYNKLRAAGRTDFEVVFVSLDRSDEEFKENYGKKHGPWVALAPEQIKPRQRLARRFALEAIPRLAVVAADHQTVLSGSARDDAAKDAEGAKFPWARRTIWQILEEARPTRKDGRVLAVADLQRMGAFALYFGAAWCPPCRALMPKLISAYNGITARQAAAAPGSSGGFEFIYVPQDKGADEYQATYDEMPWAAIAPSQAAIEELAKLLEVRTLPHVAVVRGADGSLVNGSARAIAASDLDGSRWPWAPAPLAAVADLMPSDEVIDALNADVSFILALNDSPNRATQLAEFVKAASTFAARHGPATDALAAPLGAPAGVTSLQLRRQQAHFLTADAAATGGQQGADLLARVAQAVAAQLPGKGRAFVLATNVRAERAKEVFAGDLSEAALLAFADRFLAAHKDEEDS